MIATFPSWSLRRALRRRGRVRLSRPSLAMRAPTSSQSPLFRADCRTTRSTVSPNAEECMRYLHTMVRVTNLDQSMDFYCSKLGLKEVRRIDNEKGRFTLVFLCAPADLELAAQNQAPLVELTHNWDAEEYAGGRNFGHLAYRV